MPRPLVLITPHTEDEGTELPDAAISLSNRYAEAIYAAGALPWVLPCSTDQAIVREAISRSGGVLLSGGEDVSPHLYSAEMTREVRDKVVPASGARDLFEFIVIDEVFRQSKPLLAICRGQQIVNVALGGTLIPDIPLLCPSAGDHNRQRERFEPVHDINVEADSLLESIIQGTRLRANSTHHQAVGSVAPPLRVTGRSPDGIIEALELLPGHSAALPFFLTAQFHPERLFDRYPEHARIFEAFVDCCDGASRVASRRIHPV